MLDFVFIKDKENPVVAAVFLIWEWDCEPLVHCSRK